MIEGGNKKSFLGLSTANTDGKGAALKQCFSLRKF